MKNLLSSLLILKFISIYLFPTFLFPLSLYSCMTSEVVVVIDSDDDTSTIEGKRELSECADVVQITATIQSGAHHPKSEVEGDFDFPLEFLDGEGAGLREEANHGSDDFVPPDVHEMFRFA